MIHFDEVYSSNILAGGHLAFAGCQKVIEPVLFLLLYKSIGGGY